MSPRVKMPLFGANPFSSPLSLLLGKGKNPSFWEGKRGKRDYALQRELPFKGKSGKEERAKYFERCRKISTKLCFLSWLEGEGRKNLS